MATSRMVNEKNVSDRDESEDAKPPINDVEVSNRIRKELFEQLGGKPPGFKGLEIKRITPPKSYRVNLVCSKQDERAIMNMIHRPLSYYVVCTEDGLIFSPEIVPIPENRS